VDVLRAAADRQTQLAMTARLIARIESLLGEI
jgi:hypothetical protein